jgi:hypothetical protein
MAVERLTMVLDFKLNQAFRDLFESYGFGVLWAEADAKALEAMIRPGEVDIAINYQYGREDYSLRDLVWRKDKNVPVLLTLNWDGTLPPKYEELGFAGTLKWPNTVDSVKELKEKVYSVLPEAKRKILVSLPLWETQA